jgi:hypothetical protein
VNGRSRSTLFLIEQLIVITIFALCASVCVKIFVASYIMANDARDMNRALVAAKNGAECFKAYGDAEKAAAVLGGAASGGVVYYDAFWRACGEEKASYVLRLRTLGFESAASPLACELSVEKMTGEEIIGFTVAAKRMHAKRTHARREADE